MALCTERYVLAEHDLNALLWGMAYPDHVCACADDDLSQASMPLSTPDGRFVDISCGLGHRRRVTLRAWDAEMARRRQMQEARHG